MTKYVKDDAHNRYAAYCCEDIDKRLGVLEEALASLVAGTIPDGSVTLAKLAADARTWSREINKGALFAEWIGTREEYEAHLAANGGSPLNNCKYTITTEVVPTELSEKKLPEAGYYMIMSTVFNNINNCHGLVYWDGSRGSTTCKVGTDDLVGYYIRIDNDGSLSIFLTEDGTTEEYTEHTRFYVTKIM